MLLGGLDAGDAYGLGTERTILEFEASIGVCFKELSIRHGMHNNALPETCFADAAVGDLVADLGSSVGGEKTDLNFPDQKPSSSRLAPNSSLTLSALDIVRQFVQDSSNTNKGNSSSITTK
jgi:hypothetical protein